jgi:hypothetical protein
MLEFTITGPDAAQAAEVLEAVLLDHMAVQPERRTVNNDRAEPKRAVDPIAVAALIVSIPSALLAIADLADRIRKRRKAEEVLGKVKQLIVNGNVSITVTVTGNESPVSLHDLTADKLLELATEADKPPQK